MFRSFVAFLGSTVQSLGLSRALLTPQPPDLERICMQTLVLFSCLCVLGVFFCFFFPKDSLRLITIINNKFCSVPLQFCNWTVVSVSTFISKSQKYRPFNYWFVLH